MQLEIDKINFQKKVLLCGPDLSAVSGVSTHLNHLLGSSLAKKFNLLHFQVGSEGRSESKIRKMWRLLTSPVSFFYCCIVEKPSIILLNTSLEPKSFWRDIVYLFVAKLLRIAVVYQVHGGELPDTFLGTGKLAQSFTNMCLWLPDVVVLLAEIEKKSYQQYRDVKSIVVIPNAVDVSEYANISPKLYNNDIIHLGYIGRLACDKGIKESLCALSILHKLNVLKFKYTIAGSGPAKPELMSLVNKLNLSNSVTFVPPIFGSEKTKFWAEIDIFLFPTHHKEGLPYTILESIASGTPVISSHIGAIPDVISDSMQGVFVDPHNPQNIANAIRDLASDREKLRIMSVQAIERAQEHYTIDRMASQFTRVFNQVLDK